MCSTTRNVFNKCVGVTKDQVEGISFCSAMQGLVLVDKAGNCIRRPMTYMDQRAGDELKKGIAHGVQIAGAEVTKPVPYPPLLRTLFGSTAGCGSTSRKTLRKSISGWM